MKRHTFTRAAFAAATATAVCYVLQRVLLERTERELAQAEAELTEAQADLRRAKAESAQALAAHEAAIQELHASHAAHMAELAELRARREATDDPAELAAIDEQVAKVCAKVFGQLSDPQAP
jgi:chromosome segregation ATPase